MRHPTAIVFWGLIAAVVLWVGAAALTPHSGGWPAHHGTMGSSPLLAGRGAWGAMHEWNSGPYILNQTGGPPQAADIARGMSQWLAAEGNPRLKAGSVTEKDSSTFQADIVTADGSLVQRLNVDRNSGRVTPAED